MNHLRALFLAALATLPVLPPSVMKATEAELPELLTSGAGQPIDSARLWTDVRRPELLELFRANVYGRNAIDRPESMRFTPLEDPTPAFGGSVMRQRIQIDCAQDSHALNFELRTYLPANRSPKGCFVLIVHRPRGIVENADTDPTEFWPVKELCARGYATAAFHIYNIAIDRQTTGLSSGVFAAFGPAENNRPPDAWGAIAAWSWGASRSIDYLKSMPALQNIPIAVVGHSRGGKAALWCGAQDTRVDLTISNDSGSTGAALARTTRGETVAMISQKFTHWFAPIYTSYSDRVAELPVDQHMLIALTAPRRVYVASASEDAHADPKAEFDACVAASPAFALFGLNGVGESTMPTVGETRLDGAIGYHLRAGEHDLKIEDWNHFMDYMDRWLAKN